MVDWDGGKMDGFNLATRHGHPVGRRPYAYLERRLVAPYWAMARQYVLADRMFPTEFGASFTSHIDLIASTTNLRSNLAEVNWPSAAPWGCDAPAGTWTWTLDPQRVVKPNGPFPCFVAFRTLADTLDAAGVSWKYYQSDEELWSGFDAIRNVREGSDWTRSVIEPETTVLSDAAGGALASVSWVIPNATDSDHPGSHSDTGPSWVAAVVNAIGSSAYWNSTAIVVLWDDWGGWYDDASPPQLDFVGLGIRVPCIIISPYAKTHYITHRQYEFGSVVRFVEEVFGLPALGPQTLGYTDSRANSLLGSFDFSQKARAFRKISAPYPASFFLLRKEPLDTAADPE
jgi:phospholipase C